MIYIKKIALWILIISASLILIKKGLEWKIESLFQERINSNPERAYDITYSGYDFDSFFTGLTLYDLSIKPLNPGNRAIINGHVDYTTVNGLVWGELFFSKNLTLDEIDFQKPLFEVTLNADTTKRNTQLGFQGLFGDLISRAYLNRFGIHNGSIVIIDPVSQELKGEVKNLNILAIEIETDSSILKNIIPFQVGNLIVDIDSVSFRPNDYTDLSLGHFHYNQIDKELLLNDISLAYTMDWLEVNKLTGIQTDIIEFDIKEIAIQNIEQSSNFHNQLDIKAQNLSIEELNIKLQRNKNLPRPADVVKPIFQGIINSMPMVILIDSIQISNSSLSYTELGLNKSEPGSINFKEINGDIIGFTNMPKEQLDKVQVTANLTTKLEGKAGVTVDLKIPYNKETFSLAVDIGAMDLTSLNSSLKPLADIEIVSGQMRRIQFYMNAGRFESSNKLVFDYEDLHVEVLEKKSNDKMKKNVLLSAIANGAIRKNNLPNEKNYLIADYKSQRNVYRAPTNYITQGIIQGFPRIVPVKIVQKMIIKDKKKPKQKKGQSETKDVSMKGDNKLIED